MGTLYKRTGSPYWQGCVGKYRFSTGTDKKTLAQQVLRKKEQEMWEQCYEQVDHSSKNPDEFFDKYLSWLESNKRYHTFKSYRSILKEFRRYLVTKGIRKLRAISPAVIDDYIVMRQQKSKRWTVNNHIIAIRAIFNKAKEWHYVKRNPLEGKKPVEVNDAKQIRAMSEEECRRFLAVCNRDFPEYYAMFVAFITSGMRSGELFSLEWKDIDFARRYIHIRAKTGFSPKGKDLKTNKAKERKIPLHPELAEILRFIPRTSSKVFTDNGNSFSQQKPRRLLIRIAKKARIDDLTRLHELRHTYASVLLSRGVDIFALKELLGHSDIKDTQRYSHLLPSHFDKASRLISEIGLLEPGREV